MLKLNTKGFGIVEGLLILVIVGLIGGAGYYVYKAQQNTNETLDNTGNSEIAAQKKQKKTEEKQIPEGFVEYKNEELGFSFVYPEEWGEVLLKEKAGEKGSEAVLKFSNENAIAGKLRTVNFEAGRGTDSPLYASGYVVDGNKVYSAWQYNAWKAGAWQGNTLVGEIKNAKKINSGDNEYVEVRYEDFVDTGNFYEVTINISAQSKYPGLAFSVPVSDTKLVDLIGKVASAVEKI